jgi:20S proteasome alpha/beta subunit
MKTFKWVVEFEISENWVEDGFDITPDRATDMIAKALYYATSNEFKATVLKAPEPKSIRQTQGYTS